MWTVTGVLLSLLAQADDPMLLAEVPATLDDDPRVSVVNEAFCRLSGRTADEITGRGWLALCGERAEAATMDRIKRACHRREHLAIDLPLFRADGVSLWTRVELFPLRDVRGGADIVFIIQRDMSEPRQTQDMLTSLRAMTRRASHEVNNGLASVIINLSLASSTRASTDERLERIRDALDAARDAAEITKRLSAIAANLDPDAALASDLSRKPPPAASRASDTDSRGDVSLLGSILILDDDAAVADLLSSILGRAGYRVVSTRDPEQCVEIYRDAFAAGHPFDLVILDLSIGRVQRRGLTTRTLLSAIDPHVRAIAHSGYSNDDVMLNPRQYGFVAAIQKPTAPSEMVRLIGDLIRVHAREGSA
jgi:PAS domain S-box-containing protein